jgi:hypothetical protein
MKTLEQRVQELKDQRTAKEAALQEQADRESKLMDALSRDIERYAAENGIPIKTSQPDGSPIIMEYSRLGNALIKVVSDGQGPDSFMFSSEIISKSNCSENDVLDAILKWLHS